jgi:phage terminase large subunit-like protein
MKGVVAAATMGPWLPDLEAELFAFPAGRHEDQCDSISQALEDNNTSFMQWMTPADWQRPSHEVKNSRSNG